MTLLKDSHPYGTAIIMEEPQAYFNSRMFASKTNLDAIAKFSTGRIFQYLYILTYPSFERIDSQIRERIHFLIDTDGIDRDRKLNFWKPYEVMPNWKPNMPVFRKPLTQSNKDSLEKVRCVSPRPGEDLWDTYYEKSSEWKKLVKEGRITNSGDLRKETDEIDPVDKRLALIRSRKEETRKRYLVEIEANKLWGCKTSGQIVRRIRCSYSKALGILAIILENENDNLLLESHKMEMEEASDRK